MPNEHLDHNKHCLSVPEDKKRVANPAESSDIWSSRERRLAMRYRIEGLPTDVVNELQNGGNDAYGNPPERRISDGGGTPCRHCLKPVGSGEEYLVVAHRPFSTLQPYAETGPIFVHAKPCEHAKLESRLPEILSSPDYIVRGYNMSEQIVYGTGGVIPTNEIGMRAEELLAMQDVLFVHVRSARNNCFQCRIDR